MNKDLPHIAVLGLKGFPAIGGTSSVGENLVQQLNSDYRFTVYATSSHCTNKNPYDNVRMLIFRKFLPHKLNVFYYNLLGALHALLFCKYDLIHTHQIDTGFIVPLLRLRYKVVSTHHGRTYNMSKWGRMMKYFFKSTEWLMIKCANRVTFVAETERQIAVKGFRKQFVTINNGIDPKQKIDDIKTGDDYIMFAAGRIIPHKGCHVFLEALKLIDYKGKVVIAGDHHQLDDYRKQLEAYQKDLNITFLGMLRNKSELLGYVKNAKLFVFPSFYEAMSMMLLEVAFVKTPLICSDIDENKIVFSDDEVTYFKVGDYQDLAMKIEKFLTDFISSKEKTDKAYRKLIFNFKWSSIAKLYSDVYQTLL